MSRITFLKGEHWWIWRTRPSGRTVYPKSIKVGHPDRGRTFEPVAKAKLRRVITDNGWYCGKCAVYISPHCMANALEWLKPRRCPNCGAEFDGEVNV